MMHYGNKKIAIFLPTLDGGGAERVMLNLAREFAQRGLHIDLVLANATGAYLNHVPNTVNVVDLGENRVLKSIPALAKYLRQQQPDAMLSTLIHANVAAVWAKIFSRTSTRIFVREAISLGADKIDKHRMRAGLTSFVAPMSYKLADKIIAVSQGCAQSVVDTLKISHDHIRVIYNPVSRVELEKKAQEPVDHEWFRDNKDPVIVSVGRLSAQKDFSTLIRAFSLVIKSLPAKLIILGEGEYRDSLEVLISELNMVEHISLPGFVDNPYKYVANSSVFVLSSLWEGMPNGLIEAVALGTPAVATDCPSGPREIFQDGRYGVLVPMGDEQAMAKGILSALTNPIADTINASKPFEMQTIVDEYLNALLSE